MNVHSSKTIVLTQDLKDGLTLAVKNVPFQPNEVILRGVSYVAEDSAQVIDLITIRTNLTNDIIYSFVPTIFFDPLANDYAFTLCTQPNIHINTLNIINQQVTFDVNYSSESVTAGKVYLSLILEFIKYK